MQEALVLKAVGFGFFALGLDLDVFRCGCLVWFLFVRFCYSALFGLFGVSSAGLGLISLRRNQGPIIFLH